MYTGPFGVRSASPKDITNGVGVGDSDDIEMNTNIKTVLAMKMVHPGVKAR